MKENKHIDRIFQEKLKDFDATPSDAIWERINSELHNKDSGRKVIPLWWKIAGIAASLLLMVTIGYSVFNSTTENYSDIPTEVVDTNSESNNAQEDDNKKEVNTQDEVITDDLLKNNITTENQTASSEKEEEGDSNKKGFTNSDAGNSSSKNYINSSKKDAVVNSNRPNTNERRDKSNTYDNVLKGNTNSVNTAVAVAQQNLENKVTDSSNNNSTTSGTTVANYEIPQNLPEQPTDKINASNEIKDAATNTSNTDGIVVVTENASEDKKEEGDINNNTDKVTPSIEEAMAASEDGEDYDEKEKKVIDRWSVAANVSPVYYNTLGKGSSIHDQFNKNSKSGQLNMAYGVNGSYAISNKLSIRSGINKINVGYNTNNVIIYEGLVQDNGGSFPAAAPNSGALRNIDLKEDVQGISIISGENLAFAQVPDVVAENLKSSLDQEISFIEVPLELEYIISDKNVGISVIGGFSTLLLNNNNVYADFDDKRKLLGEANNINNVSYSANLGVGLGLKISERIKLNFEPTFKYQIKTFNNATGDFKPYIIGINSGLKFKF